MAGEDRTGVLVSWDNATIHNFKARLAELGLHPTQLIDLPPHSPDLHQLIEHVFARLKQQLVVAMYRLGWEKVTPQIAIDMVLSLLNNTFDTVCTPSVLQRDLHNVINCYKIVAAPTNSQVWVNDHWVSGTDGGWPPKGFR